MEPLRDATTVIQCPNCHTKFAVETSQIESYELPRFHCSRCDNVFSFEEGPSNVTSYEAKETPRETSSSSISIPRSLDRNFSSMPPHESAPHENPLEEASSLKNRIEKFDSDETQMAFDFV